MVSIANFGSVLEIVFAMNSILFMFDILKDRETILENRYERFRVVAQRKIHSTADSEVPPLRFVLSSTYAISRLLMKLVSMSMSAISLGLLIWCGFNPDANASGYLMALFLAIGLTCTPVLSALNWTSFKKSLRVIEEAISLAELTIKDHEEKNY